MIGTGLRVPAYAVTAALSAAIAFPSVAQASDADEMAVAERLAALLQSSREIVSEHQYLINDPAIGDKHFEGDHVLQESSEIYERLVGEDLFAVAPETRSGRLLQAQMQAMKEVIDENQDTINTPGVGFKGFIPETFARLANAKFTAAVGDEARLKVTAPMDLVRNRTARPDEWEQTVLDEKLSADDWPKDQPYSEVADVDGRPAFRMIFPEYYQASCLECHGEPAGELDITGYPKEGGEEGDLGSAISIILFR